MKLLYVLPCWLCAITSVEAGKLRKRLRNSLEVYEPEDTKSHGGRFSSFLDEKDMIIDVRDLVGDEMLMMSMSMPSDPSPVTSPPTRDGGGTPSPTRDGGGTPSPTTDGATISPTIEGATMSPTSPGVTSSPTSTPAPTVAPTVAERDNAIVAKCEQTSLERSRDILSILTLVSEETSLLIVGTPQFNARIWLDETDPLIICADEPERVAQRYRAAVLYYALGGSDWTTSTGWLTGAHECEWFGIQCDGYDDASAETFFPITGIDLNENNLVGALPEEVFGLISLMRILMQKNAISGNISPEIGNLQQLRELDLDENQLSGSLPLTLYTLEEINKIDLNSNQLSGELSEDIGNMLKLQILQLEENNFTGPVPTAGLLKLEKLVALTIQLNGFSGSLEPLCDVIDERRTEYQVYLGFLFADSCGDPPPVECSCCTCL